MPEPTEVCFTIDTEFSIGGHFQDPTLRPVAEPIVLGTVEGREHGLGFLLDSFTQYGVCATFFVEALQTAYFGDAPMGAIVRRIAEAGQDVQLHLHPCWLHFEPRAAQGTPAAPNDSCAGRTDPELDHLIGSGLAAFSRWQLPPPVAVRTGNFQVDANFYRSAARAGIKISSSVALALRQPAEKQLELTSGVHRIGPLREYPVLTYAYGIGGHRWLRSLCITACTSSEIISVLRQARRRGMSPIVILTHPQEFIKRKDFRYTTLRRNRVNQNRLTAVLEFLRQNGDDFVVQPISALGDPGESREDEGPHEADDKSRPDISVPFGKAVIRMVNNGVNDLIWRY